MIRVLLAAVFALVLLPGMAAAQSQPSPEDAGVSDFFTPEEIARADAYRGPRYAIGITSLVVSLATLGLLGLGRGSRLLAEWSARATGGRHVGGKRWVRRAALLTLIVTLTPLVVTFPLLLVRHRLDTAFGLATDPVASFLRDVAVATSIEIVISLIAAALFLAVVRTFRRAWPALVALGGAVLTVAMVFLFPLVFEPAFNRFTPVDPETRARVLALADRAGVRVDDVLVADASRRTTAHNAYVSGLGATKRVVLYDTLLAEAPRDEVDLVVAHELSHVVNDDVRNGALLGAAGVALGALVLWMVLRRGHVLAALGATSPGDPAVIPFVAFFLAFTSLATLPLQNAISRSVEGRADRAAIELTGDASTAIAVEVRLSRENLSDLTPHPVIRWIFFTHPAPMERIRAALAETR